MRSPRLLLLLLLSASWQRETVTAPKTWLPSRISLRVVAVGFVVGLILDIVIAVLLIVDVQHSQKAITRSVQASEAVQVVKVAQYQSCLATESVKAADLTRWDAVLRLVNTTPNTPEMQAFIKAVDAANRTADRPKVCVAP